MKNHFIFSYMGNKREEVEIIHDEIKDKLEGIETIIEPFCGTSAFSYYISTLYPGRFKYVLNDMTEQLIILYKILQNEEETLKLIQDLKNIYPRHEKELYKSIISKTKGSDRTFLGFVLYHMSYSMVPGLFEMRADIVKIHSKFDKIIKAPIINFLRTENITLTVGNGFDIYKNQKNDPSLLIFMDPPYMISDNSCYENNSQDVYEYLFYNDIKNEQALIVLVLEYTWIVKLLFPNPSRIYPKRYSNNEKKKTTHAVILNK